jgi:hypothetical protein
MANNSTGPATGPGTILTKEKRKKKAGQKDWAKSNESISYRWENLLTPE